MTPAKLMSLVTKYGAACGDVQALGDRGSQYEIVAAERHAAGLRRQIAAEAKRQADERVVVEKQRDDALSAVESLGRQLADARLALARVTGERDLYAPIAVPILADIKERNERAARMAAHTHYCWTCSDGDAPGEGCHNCRDTGMDQTPCVGCPGPKPAATPPNDSPAPSR